MPISCDEIIESLVEDPDRFWVAVVRAALQLKLLVGEDIEALHIFEGKPATKERELATCRFFGMLAKRFEAAAASRAAAWAEDEETAEWGEGAPP